MTHQQIVYDCLSSSMDQFLNDMKGALAALPGDISDNMLIATNELLINSIAEMKRLGREKAQIKVDVWIKPDEVVVHVVDEGAGFSLAQHPEDSRELLSENGRGLFMVQLLTDSFTSVLTDQGCTCCEIKKKIKQGGPPDEKC